MNRKLNILILIKPFWKYPKHQPKFDMIQTIEKYANVTYWYEDGHIKNILKKLEVKPDFIFHYDIAWRNGLAPRITGLGECEIPKGCFVIDLHWEPNERIRYFEMNKIDMIFSASKHPFLYTFPQYESKLYWLPWSINPEIYKDRSLKKDIDYLLMGLVYVELANESKFKRPGKTPPKGRYKFRDEVFQQLNDQSGFIYHPHPGHRMKGDDLIVREKYAREFNRAKMFFTCGSRSKSGGYAVLKFFEAPACKTLLLAEPNKDIEALGFRDGENFVACTVDQITEKANYYLLNDKKREEITINGYQFIHENHTNDHRIQQMIANIEEFLYSKN